MTGDEFVKAIESGEGDKAALAFIAYGGDIHAPLPGCGLPPIHVAVECENIPMVQALFNLGVDINIRDKDGLTPLHRAVALDIDTAEQTAGDAVNDFMRKLTFKMTGCVAALGADRSILTPAGLTARDYAAAINGEILARYDEAVDRAERKC